MNLKEDFTVALASLKANKVRTLFSVLGIIIGTCSVIVVVSVVNGTRVATLEQMRAGKENLLLLRPNYSEQSGRFGSISLEDVERIKRLSSVLTAYPDVSFEAEARGRHGKDRLKFLGVDHHYARLFKLKLVEGRFFSEEESASRPYICVISDKKARKLFGFDFPLGQRVRLENGVLEVVGVYKEEERLRQMDQFQDVIVPLQSLMGFMQNISIFSVQIRAKEGQLEKAKKDIQALIDSAPGQKDLLSLTDIRLFYQDTEKWAKSMLIQMSLIAAISLLVGGVGLMNVMLISITERTHEIGLRKALGANASMLLGQFLMESVTLSGLGGIGGTILGVFISYCLATLSSGKILVDIMPLSIVVSLIFSIIVGIVFGLFPASKAARLSPVEALRHE